MTTTHMWKAKEYIVRTESFYTDVYEGTTDTGESSPIWSVRFMEHKPTAPMEIIEGKAAITIGQRNTRKRVYAVDAETPTRLLENTLYFPGWRALVDNEPVPVEFQDPNHRGLMTFWLPPGQHQVEVVFGETKLRFFANIITLFSIGLVVFWYGKTRRSSLFG